MRGKGRRNELLFLRSIRPLGVWKANLPHNRSATLKEDNTLTGGHGGKTWTGTWKWTGLSKGALAIIIFAESSFSFRFQYKG